MPNNLNADFYVVSNNLVAELVVQYTPNKTSQLMNDSGFVTQENIDTAITTEANARITTDESLQEQIDSWEGSLDSYRTASAQDVIDNTIRGEIATEANVRLANDQVLQRNINTKQDIITDLNTIRAGASAGATAVQPAELNNYVPTTRKVNGKALATDITLTASDVGALSTDTLHNSLNGRASSDAHPISAITDLQNTLNGKQETLTTVQLAALNSGIDANLVSEYSTHVADTDIHVTTAEKTTWSGKQDAITDLSTIRAGASAGATAVQPAELNNYVPTTRKVNGKALTTDITLSASDVGALSTDTLHNSLNGRASSDAHPISAITDLQNTLNGKQDAITDLSTIRAGASAGATAVQPVDLATVATTGAYSDLIGTPTIPTVNDATLTIQKNGTTVQTFTANSNTNKIANITVPTDTGDLTNGAGFITSSDVPVVDVTVGGSSVLSNRIAQIPSIPTTASDVGALPSTTNYGANLSYNPNNSSLTLLDQNGNTLGNSVTIVSGDSLPSQAGNAGKFLTTDGTDASWASISAADTNLSNITATGENVIKNIFDTKIVLVNSLPATPDNDVWYAIPE